MNIFVVDENPELAASYLCDQHVHKMFLESVQILSDINGGPYARFNPNHPVVRWAAAGQDNCWWLLQHTCELARQYRMRFKKQHKSEIALSKVIGVWQKLPRGGTPFVQCMPEQYRRPDAVEAYRAFYLGDKMRFARWKRSTPPWWVTQACGQAP